MAVKGPKASDPHPDGPERQRRTGRAGFFASRCKAEGGGKNSGRAVAREIEEKRQRYGVRSDQTIRGHRADQRRRRKPA